MSSLEAFAICWIAGCIAAGICELIRIKLNAPVRIKRDQDWDLTGKRLGMKGDD